MYHPSAPACQISKPDLSPGGAGLRPGAQPTTRLFLALLPSDAVRAALVSHADQWSWPDSAARYAPHDWHITLHFIGAVATQRLEELRTALRVPVQPFELRLGHPALWPHGLAVLCPLEVPPSLQQLHLRLDKALQALGLLVDPRRLRPHLTLARRAQGAVPPVQPLMLDWPVAGYALVASDRQTAQRYCVVQRYGPP